jgi:hypothetical protein
MGEAGFKPEIAVFERFETISSSKMIGSKKPK